MRSLLIALDGSHYMVMLPRSMRHRIYAMADPIPLSVVYGEWTAPIQVEARLFEWRGQIVRRDGSELVDFFEEIPS